MFLAVLSHSYEEQDLSTPEKPDSREVLKFPAKLAPMKQAVLPLMKKDGLPEIASLPSAVSTKKKIQLVYAIAGWMQSVLRSVLLYITKQRKTIQLRYDIVIRCNRKGSRWIR